MLVQQSLFDVYSESGENHVSEREALKASQDEKKITTARALSRKQTHSYWKLSGSVWQTIIFLTNLYAGLGKIIGMFGPISKDWWAQNLILMAGSIAATAIVVELGTRNPLLVRKFYRIAINVIEKRKGRIQR
jgi:hypothetical protein